MRITKRGYEFEVEQYTKETLPQLLERVKLGNEKLIKAWDDIRAIKDNESHDKAAAEWMKANELLSCYCDQLDWLDYHDCLYIEDGKKIKNCLRVAIGCRVCPSTRHYWEEEFMDLGRKDEKPNF